MERNKGRQEKKVKYFVKKHEKILPLLKCFIPLRHFKKKTESIHI